jgi:hypothetical protein
MNIYDVANRLAEMREGEDVAFDIEVTVKARLSIGGSNNASSGVSATLIFKTTKDDELLYSAELEKTGFTKEPLPPDQGLYILKSENLPLPLLDLVEVLRIDPENNGWYESGHGQFIG